ncbi:hypothetical protein L6V77_17945 [Myxococcota bacterium]|nr:hypothetical protein [Myxococcota bacterium]
MAEWFVNARFRRAMGMWLAIPVMGGALASGCGGGDSGGGATATDAGLQDAAPAPDPDAAPVDAGSQADASLADRAAAFCESLANARCTWALACDGLSAGDRAGILGLAGDDLAACTANAAALCTSAATARAERGTLAFDPVEVEDCLDGVSRAPCQPSPAADWIADYGAYFYERCGRVLSGNVEVDGECTTAADCAAVDALCDEGKCRISKPIDLQGDCDATNRSAGVPNGDDTCVGGLCVQVGTNSQDKLGMCTVDCRETAQACPTGTQCLHVTAGNAHYAYCTVRCERDAQCHNGFVCVAVNPDEPDGAKHCWAERR